MSNFFKLIEENIDAETKYMNASILLYYNSHEASIILSGKRSTIVDDNNVINNSSKFILTNKNTVDSYTSKDIMEFLKDKGYTND